MVGGLRERNYQLAAQKRNEACRRLDLHCQTARYFERESRLAKQFNSWSTDDNCVNNKFDGNKSKVEKLERRKNNLRKLLRDEDEHYREQVKRLESSRGEKKYQEVSVEELKKKLEIKRAERSLYYPINYRSYQSFNGVSDPIASCPRHYVNERHIGACRNSQATMEDTNPWNYSSLDNQSRRKTPENNHHGEKRHSQGSNFYGIDGDSSRCDSSNRSAKHSGERRHYEAVVDSVDEGTNPHFDKGYANEASADRFRTENEKMFGYSGHAAVSERRHYGQYQGNSGRSLANTNLRQAAVNQPEDKAEIEIYEESEADGEEREPDPEEAAIERAAEDEVQLQVYNPTEAPNYSDPDPREFNNEKNRSTDNINFSWKYDDPNKRPVCFLTHNELIHQIQDLANRELQACKKQNWSEALRLRDMRNRLELQREIEVFNQNDLNMNNAARQAVMMKIADRIKLMDEREVGSDQHLIYSEEARNLWEVRVREDEKILSTEDRAQREILLKELEEEWEAMTLKDNHRVAESPVKHNKSHLQEELELTAAAINKVVETMDREASNHDSKNSCTRNRDKSASSLIFLG